MRLDSDRTGAYVHCLIPKIDLTDLTSLDNIDVSEEIATGFTLIMTVDTWASAVRDQSPLYLKNRAHMAGYC